MTEKADVYTRVTSKILADLERGNLTWGTVKLSDVG
jgi:antirestriction protein ArdC